MSANASSICLEVLDEWISTNDADKIISVGDLLKHSPSDFIFINSGFVSNLLDHSFYAGDECNNYIKHILSGIPFNKVLPRAIGEPSQETIDIRDRAIEMLKQFDVGSPAYIYYESVKKNADLSIAENQKRDEEILE